MTVGGPAEDLDLVSAQSSLTVGGWKPWATSYRWSPAPRAVAEVLADVLRQVPRRQPRLAERARADGQVAEQLDVDDAVAPRRLIARPWMNRPTAKWTWRPCPLGCHSGTQRYGKGSPGTAPSRRKKPPTSSAERSRVVQPAPRT